MRPSSGVKVESQASKGMFFRLPSMMWLRNWAMASMVTGFHGGGAVSGVGRSLV
jgi:hypothetical protein